MTNRHLRLVHDSIPVPDRSGEAVCQASFEAYKNPPRRMFVVGKHWRRVLVFLRKPTRGEA